MGSRQRQSTSNISTHGGTPALIATSALPPAHLQAFGFWILTATKAKQAYASWKKTTGRRLAPLKPSPAKGGIVISGSASMARLALARARLRMVWILGATAATCSRRLQFTQAAKP